MAVKVATIKTERLLFRGIDETDAEKIVSWRSDPVVFKYFKSPHMITIDEHLNWYRKKYLRNDNCFCWICIEKESHKKIGIFGLTKENDIAEVNYLLAPEAQHNGYALEGIKRLIIFATEILGVKQVIAEIHKHNIPSVTVIRKLGFKFQSEKGNFMVYETEV